jgi:serine/threonine protein kinase
MFDPESGFAVTAEAEHLIATSWNAGEATGEKRDFGIGFITLSVATDGFSPQYRIGGGGSCEVFKATVYGTVVAIKALNEKAAESHSPEAETELDIDTKQFVAEMKTLRACRHPNVLKLLAVSLDGPKRCLVLPICEGGPLHKRIKIAPPLTGLQRLQVIVAIVRALAYLHSKKLIHRDVKSQASRHLCIAGFHLPDRFCFG